MMAYDICISIFDILERCYVWTLDCTEVILVFVGFNHQLRAGQSPTDGLMLLCHGCERHNVDFLEREHNGLSTTTDNCRMNESEITKFLQRRVESAGNGMLHRRWWSVDNR